jgi:hypothetical protein
MASWNPEGFSPQIRLITGNNWLGASPAEASQGCTLFATVVVQVDLGQH